MFDFLRNVTKSEEEKRQEQLNAYLDDALSPRERQQFEALLADDAALRAALTQLRALREDVRRLPRRRVPRNFTLDPALYGRPQPQPLVQAYPLLRAATALTALIFVIALGAELFLPGAQPAAVSDAVPVALEAPAEEELAVEEAPQAQMAAEAVETTTVLEAPALEMESVEEEAAADEGVADEALIQTEPAEAGAAGAAEPAGGGGLPPETSVAEEDAARSALATPAPESLQITPTGAAQEVAAPSLSGTLLAAVLLGALLVVLLLLTLTARRRIQRIP